MKNKKYIFAAVASLTATTLFSQNVALDSAFSQSERMESKSDFKSAIDIMKRVYDASSYEINLRLGWLNYIAKQNTESVSYYNKAIGISPYALEPRLFFVEPAALLGNTGDLITQYIRILQISPQNSTANYWLGMIYYNKKDYYTAKGYFEKVLNLYPFDYSSLLMDGWAHYYLGSKDTAKTLFEKVLLISSTDKSAGQGLSLITDASNSTSADGLKNLIPVFKQSEDFESNKDYKSAIAIIAENYDNNSYEMNLRLGWLNYENGDYVQSISYYKKAIALKPHAIEPMKGSTYPLNAMGNVTELINQYNNILAIDPQNYDANYWLGMVYYNKKDYQSALKYFDKIVKLYPFGYDGVIVDAWAKYYSGETAAAKTLFEKVMLLTPNDNQVQDALNNLSSSK